jgi:hypothetical protein
MMRMVCSLASASIWAAVWLISVVVTLAIEVPAGIPPGWMIGSLAAEATGFAVIATTARSKQVRSRRK